MRLSTLPSRSTSRWTTPAAPHRAKLSGWRSGTVSAVRIRSPVLSCPESLMTLRPGCSSSSFSSSVRALRSGRDERVRPARSGAAGCPGSPWAMRARVVWCSQWTKLSRGWLGISVRRKLTPLSSLFSARSPRRGGPARPPFRPRGRRDPSGSRLALSHPRPTDALPIKRLSVTI